MCWICGNVSLPTGRLGDGKEPGLRRLAPGDRACDRPMVDSELEPARRPPAPTAAPAISPALSTPRLLAFGAEAAGRLGGPLRVWAWRTACDDGRERGVAAVREHTSRFDKADRPSPRVPREALSSALAGIDPAVAEALTEAARRARAVHEAQLPAQTVTVVADGSSVTERYVPGSRAGVYGPCGLVAYPSSGRSHVIPAQV